MKPKINLLLFNLIKEYLKSNLNIPFINNY